MMDSYYYDEENIYTDLNEISVDDFKKNYEWMPYDDPYNEWEDFYDLVEEDNHEEYNNGTSDKVIQLEEKRKKQEKIKEQTSSNQPIDYLEQCKQKMIIGKKGEDFAYNFEFNKLKGTPYQHRINRNKANNPENGYDILSFEKDGTPLHIEVKATSRNEGNFKITQNELEKAQIIEENGGKHVIYFIKEIFSKDPHLNIIEDIFNNQRVSYKPILFEGKYI